jgi:demethylmenaquinone methyltransferase/2-methoxy-6-polyprenyl-1,4-benzoquinol methylase
MARPTQPHPVLPKYYRDSRHRAEFVRALFDASCADYDRINRLLSLGSGTWYRRRVLRDHGLIRGDKVLDVAVGTGLLAREASEIVQRRGIVVGLDSSFGMLAQAQTAAPLPLVQGRAETLPFADASFDFVTIGYALRHMTDLGSAFDEFRRVLKPGGTLLILEIVRAENRLAHAAAMLWMRIAIPAICGLAMRSGRAQLLMRYFWDTVNECVPAATVEAELAAAGFSAVRRTTTLGVLREYAARAGSGR